VQNGTSGAAHRELHKAQFDDARDWLKWAWGEYLKWYAAFLALNIAAFSFFALRQMALLAWIFIFLIPISITVGLMVAYWTKSTLRIVSESFEAVARDVTISGNKTGTAFPVNVMRFTTLAVCFTQCCFLLLWYATLYPKRLPFLQPLLTQVTAAP
jgi:small-conductance mechanosensitive channel